MQDRESAFQDTLVIIVFFVCFFYTHLHGFKEPEWDVTSIVQNTYLKNKKPFGVLTFSDDPNVTELFCSFFFSIPQSW